MKSEHYLLLLKILRFNGNVQQLVDIGYEFSEIVEAIRIEEKHGNVTIKKGVTILTKKGLQELNKLESMAGRKFPWIEPEIKSRIIAIDVNDIYIPLRGTITHLLD